MQLRTLILAILFLAALLLAWQLSHTLLVIFSGVLIACVLDAAVRGLSRVVPFPRQVLLAIVTLVVVAILSLAITIGGVSLWRSSRELLELLVTEANRLYAALQDFGIFEGLSAGEQESMFRSWLPDPAGIFDQASTIFGSTLGILGDVVIILFLGLFFAINPKGYMDGFLLLMPAAHRDRIRVALGATGEALRGWMVTQLAMMVLIGTLVFILLTMLGVANAPVLALLAGSLNFVPFLGPIFSAIPVLLVLASEDTSTLIAGAIGLFLIQNLEGYILTPMLQQRIIRLSPAWSLSVMAILGSLFGFMGIALATPIFAVIRTLVLKLYVEPQTSVLLDHKP